MYKHILVPTDGFELADTAVFCAIELAKALGAKLSVVYAVPEYSPSGDFLFPVSFGPSREDYASQAAHEADLIFRPIIEACAAASVDCSVVWAYEDRPHRLILATAKDRGCDLICMASHGRGGIGALILGSETQKVLALGQLPVLVVRSAGADRD
jgi:nucleotide-binding universal stress UspA family protein